MGIKVYLARTTRLGIRETEARKASMDIIFSLARMGDVGITYKVAEFLYKTSRPKEFIALVHQILKRERSAFRTLQMPRFRDTIDGMIKFVVEHSVICGFCGALPEPYQNIRVSISERYT